MKERKLNILLVATGSVATVKIPQLVVAFSQLSIHPFSDEDYSHTYCIETRILLSSPAAAHFLMQAKNYNSEAWDAFVDLGE
jgi:hypothetical protein